MKETAFFRQAELLLDILPLVAIEPHFALKGGTAINFFIRDLPRLSVDIDLTYLPIEDRESTLKNIDSALRKLSARIKKIMPSTKIFPNYLKQTEFLKGLIIKRADATVKIEPNLIMRGSVFPSEKRMLVRKAQNLFEKAVEAQLLSFDDLYAGKICAALDRQHPRDLIDVKLLLENEGFTENIRQAFIVYLISHNRPMVELLNPNRLNIRHLFETEFSGMTTIPITLEELLQTRNLLINEIKNSLTINEKKFLFSFKRGQAEWERLPFKHIQDLPAVQWKLQNIRNMNASKRRKALQKLAEYLALD